MSDITTLFKATVKTVKTRQKQIKDVDMNVFPSPKQHSVFTKKCQQVVY